ncbi:autotransporter outer membrane beta-barrel domain-containing protein [Pseudomonas sichuanensis]|uniref:autotransporter outer membrane beta-barrel domain-containing protein n=1 Tax=Pseudomonas sichuanensis TaxID=2213015 RepID=UPI0024475E10|nr:autotransporter outer membrane beta-barrel domain-containing protein [Pseudomonas sichuanensis]MDH0730384.1 autotransporter outer membrane beta-barrel domain-containing protein [Pseudomonas sichuanensis]MDH1583685.1 autotransporter outer membrane beta-barrel domain-containing protein [Pseudomonas sichuanensis]MDH1594232.1 autotransporter outer membrane beta-barrel domain-containing protein [Pseudomonas sichuanensis]MDH1597857.1 autotransporter outer membrane beta-barrel domain-containing pro
MPSNVRHSTALPRLNRLALLSPLLFATSAWAQTNIIDDTLIDASTALDSYRVIGPATLTGNGAATLQISAEAGSSVVLSDSQVNAQPNATGLSLIGASAILQRTTVTSDARGLGMNSGASALIIDSTIEGGDQGALINASQATLQGSELRGTKANSAGAQLFGGTLVATQGSVISGGANGVRVRENQGPDGSRLVIDNSLVEGRSGSAILVGGLGTPASASIEVLNGSTLSGGNGVLLEVSGNSSADLRVNDSQLVGDIVAAAGGTANVLLENGATLKGRLKNVASLGLDSGAEWTMVEDSQVGDLTLNDGAVRFGGPGEFFTLSLDNLAGNGTFIMEANFAAGQADHLEITGTATGSHGLLISSSGSDPLNDTSLHVVHAAAGDAQFSLVGGPVDLGAYAYDLVQRGPNDWFLDASTRTLSSGTQTVMALGNVTPTIWYGELATLRSRMGEVRRNPQQSGGWVRTYANRHDISATTGAAYQQQQHGLSIGADTPLAIGDGNWLVGVTAGYSTSDLSLVRGSSATVDSYHAGAYATWLDPDSGYYLDAVARLNRFRHKADVHLSDGRKAKGDYANLGAGVSVEVGRQLALADDWFLEPFAQLSGLVVEGKAYTLDNGMRAESEATRSLLAKAGATVGRTIKAGENHSIQPYLRVAAVHEFVNDNQVKVNSNRFNNDLSGSRGEVGIGVAVAWAEKWQAHADFDYSNGRKIEQPWGVNFGVRYNW